MDEDRLAGSDLVGGADQVVGGQALEHRRRRVSSRTASRDQDRVGGRDEHQLRHTPGLNDQATRSPTPTPDTSAPTASNDPGALEAEDESGTGRG